MLRVVQLRNADGTRAVALVEEPSLRPLDDADSAYRLALAAIARGTSLGEIVAQRVGDQKLDYDAVYAGRSPWRLLPAFDHPASPHACLVTGTGLTHRASAESRSAMHVGGAAQSITDSMRMYRAGIEGGKPPPGQVGAQPEWFYKGNGAVLRAHGEPLGVPNFGLDGGEEAEIAGLYVIGPTGTPFRVGFAVGNEFSDHVGEARNYLYLAESKLRACAIGPELVVSPGDDFLKQEIRGQVRIERVGQTRWESELASGEPWMCHTLANLEHHHFKNEFHRRPGDAHVHFFGADAFSFRDKIVLEDGDEMIVSYGGFGRPLRNPIRIDCSAQQLTRVKAL
jgi:hypothetical protein